MKYSEKDIKRFWSKVDKDRSQTFYNGTRCWEWTEGQHKNGGYGAVWIGNKGRRAHCVSYEIAYGDITSEKPFVLHHCDNPLCVNPQHLFLGTHQDNMADKVSKGRQAHGETHGAYTHPESRRIGESNGRAKLTKENVVEIRGRYGRFGKGGETLKQLAKEFDVTFALIAKIVKKELWKDGS